MAKSAYIGMSSKAKKVKKIYVGVDGVAKKVKKAYIGVDGVAKLFYAAGGMFFGVCGQWYPFEYNTADGTKTQLSQPSQFAQRMTTIQYSNGKWIWATNEAFSSSSYQVHINVMDEKTHALTSTLIKDTATGMATGYASGIAADDNNVYVLITNTNNGQAAYFVTMKLSDYSYTATCFTSGVMRITGNSNGYDSWMVMLPNGKFLLKGSYNYPVVYDRSNNTASNLTQVQGVSSLQDRAISSNKVVYVQNGYNLAVTDGSTVTTWNDSTGSLVPYSSAQMAYGNGKFIYRSANGYFISTDNGTTWTKTASTGIGQAKAITFGDGMFFAIEAIGNSGTASLRVSTDAINWTEVATHPFDSIYKCVVAYSDIHGVGK